MTTATRSIIQGLTDAASRLADDVDRLSFADPVTHVYNPLRYAWDAHAMYLSRAKIKKGTGVIFLGMNPGPWGMAQTGVPFGEIAAVRDWIGINVPVDRPQNEHPKRPVQGFASERSEVSGRRLWGLFQQKFKTPARFFARHFITNYCPLVFMESSARNRTPDKLPAEEREPLGQICDQHLQTILTILQPKHVVGVGAYAEKCLSRVLETGCCDTKLSRILHPQPCVAGGKQGLGGKSNRAVAVGKNMAQLKLKKRCAAEAIGLFRLSLREREPLSSTRPAKVPSLTLESR